MKKFWVYLLAALLFAALAMTCACAEADEEIILGDGSDLEVQLEAADDGIILEDDLSMDDVELPITEENDGISLDLSPEGLEPATVPADNAVASNDGAEDFEIINGILVKYKGAGGDVVIPNSVTVIGEKAFYECDSLTSVSIPDSVTSIGEDAFYRCSSLISVSIPDSVTSIGEDAFYRCSSLISVSIPDSVTSIGEDAFYRCSSLTSVSIP
ncbi:MAG: leucine-rich repeat domain-containing protein, partial [Clostridia bacterium]|nr:leucine-rich repeat domain-containing protein [Clostridia bacterium]